MRQAAVLLFVLWTTGAPAQQAPGLGYLKPLFRRAILDGERYREDLRIGEDYDLVLRLLAGGARR